MNPEREEQFQDVVRDLKNNGLFPEVILHIYSNSPDLPESDRLSRQLDSGVYSVLFLCRALMHAELRAPVKVLSACSTAAGSTAPLAAAMAGLLKTLSLENPKFTARVVHMQGSLAGDFPLPQQVRFLWDECCDHDWTATEVRYRGRERYVHSLAPWIAGERHGSRLPLRQKGVYLITGGLGSLGLIFAEYLARNYQATLILIGRSMPNQEQEERLRQLESYGAEILFLPADVAQLADVERVVGAVKARFSALHGVIHAAGIHRDSFLLNKTRDEMEAVLAPKVYGTTNLDLATRDENLDLFVLFSSVAGVIGNVGQSDYAYANHFLDSFAEHRESLRAEQKRSGRTLSINWPLWQAGGMQVSPEEVALLEHRTGLCLLPAEEGVSCWEDILRSDAVQAIPLYGFPSRIAAYIAQNPVTVASRPSLPSAGVDHAALFSKTEFYLKSLIGEEIKSQPERISSSERLEAFGIDSIMIGRFNSKLETDLGALPKTLLYEYETIRDLTRFLLRDKQEALLTLFASSATHPEAAVEISFAPAIKPGEQSTVEPNPDPDPEPIAIIGIHGYYPLSADLDQYWENLKQGRDLIQRVPPDRWAADAPEQEKIYCKWGGFLEDYDKFDPEFFNISPQEAKMMDPQERLFLQSVWAAIEDAGYTRESLKQSCPKARSADVGVFAGVTTNSYHQWTAQALNCSDAVSPSSLPWSIANRVSYFFDFNGPSMPVDTACSSSLVAVHLACQSLRHRECQVAIAGGVNLYLHPSKYQSLCEKRALSQAGRCRSYGAGDDGFVPGEGVGTLLLKPLSRAISDGDQVYAVIRASAFEHSGRSNGYSAPNPNSQARLIRRALQSAHIDPASISYVEGHGTGTQFGDSIEIAALTQAFAQQTGKKPFCAIGSVKANIGHSESAAGMAGLAKIILQIKHRQLAPSLHSDPPNPDIPFQESPFYLQHTLSSWDPMPGEPRRALINAFGAGGVNACVVLEEHESPHLEGGESGPYVFVLSARNEDRLRAYADRLVTRLTTKPHTDLAALCYTLQVGREAMEARIAMVVSGLEELIERLRAWSERGLSANIFGAGADPLADPVHAAEEQSRLASLWAAGKEVAWSSLYPGKQPRRIALPTYPFCRHRYWFSDSPNTQKPSIHDPRLHPLVSYNSSTLRDVCFTSSLPETAFYTVDHQVNQARIFPGAAFLEIACIAGNIGGEQRVRKITDVAWMQPLVFCEGAATLRTSLKQTGETVEYVISSLDDDHETLIHSEGRLVYGNSPARSPMHEISLDALKAQCAPAENGALCYQKFRAHGFDYGPSFQVIEQLYTSDSFALSRLKLPHPLKTGFAQFILHPSIMDGALQTMAGLLGGQKVATPHVPFALDELEILRPVPQTCYAYAQFAGSRGLESGVLRFNIQLLSDSGTVLVRFKNLFVRPLAKLPSGAAGFLQTELVLVPGD